MSFKTPLGKTIFETKPISAGCEFVSGYAFKSKDFSESGYPVIKIKNIQNKQVTLNGDNQFIPKNVITEKLNKFKLTHGDILIAMTGQGSVGRVGKLVLNDKQVTPYLNQRVGKFVPHHNVLDKDYLYYVISTSAYESLLFAAGSGSGQPNLSPSVIKGVEIPFPPIKVQESISKILRDLDEKIVTNVQMNQTLEEMAQAIFKSWFVDFDPVKAKMNGEQPEGMDAATASLFPDKLVESELGLIPDGWDIATIKDFGSVVCGKTPSKKNADFYGGDVPFIKIPDTHGKVFITETTDTLTQAGDESQPKKRIPENSICVSCIATVGQVFITTKPSHTNQQINSVVPHDANSLYPNSSPK
ncbi:restriction endonuclease subunit S, partial [Vibrio fluvialis]|uniref:restriction endonuclease subunit S n=1 Tax=Vibrio fluvialis TaxID=676 RepID=UPI0006E27088